VPKIPDDDDSPHGRRNSDQWARWLTAFNAAVSSLAVGLIVLFYANIPKEMAEFREKYAAESAYVRAELGALRAGQADTNETLKAMLPIRDRVLIVEQKIDRIERVDVEQEKRLDKLEGGHDYSKPERRPR
jgi:hypothetical protein